ncbi:OmpH family outer membrane protein [Winogradskyella psychrotolerans]|nr:OmpH family outer membrane protein [Winogradskyella psychrotolerans]
MKFKVLFLLIVIGLATCSVNAQRGVRIGYIDTEYILENVPEYKEASSQLNKKVLQWKTEIESKLNAIEQKKKELDNESVLLTKELYDERYEDITFEEAEVLDYQQKRFGPEGDLMIQKRQLIEPIQDQIFAAVQEIAETKKYDFVFDKSADVVMLYSAERYDMSEQVLRTITRTSKRTQAKTKKERQELEDEEVVPEVNSDKDARQQALEDRKASREEELAAKRAEREKAAEERKIAQQELRDAKKKEAEERRQKVIDERNARSGSTASEVKTIEVDTTSKAKAIVKSDSIKVEGSVKKDSISSETPKTAAEIAADIRAQKLKDREARQKALEERKQKIIEQRKKAREEREKQVQRNDSIAKAKKNEDNN